MLPGLLFTYRNTLHESTGKKPSFLVFGVHPRTPPKAAWMSSAPLLPTDLSDYREELMGFSIQCPGTSSYSDSSCSMPVHALLMTRTPRRPASELVIGSLFVFRLRKLEQDGSYHIPSMAPTGSPASTTRMLLPSKCTSHRKMQCMSTCPECALPPVTSQLVTTGMGDLAVDLVSLPSGLTLSQ